MVCFSLNGAKAVNTRGKKTTPWAVYMLFVLETTSFSILQTIWEEINLMVQDAWGNIYAQKYAAALTNHKQWLACFNMYLNNKSLHS